MRSAFGVCFSFSSGCVGGFLWTVAIAAGGGMAPFGMEIWLNARFSRASISMSFSRSVDILRPARRMACSWGSKDILRFFLPCAWRC